jgi:acetamidase/formamidase
MGDHQCASVDQGEKVNTPRFENDEFIMSVGSIRPLDDCLRIAYGDMVDWLMEDYGLDKADASQLLSPMGRVRVGNVVDTPYTVVVKVPKKNLPKK